MDIIPGGRYMKKTVLIVLLLVLTAFTSNADAFFWTEFSITITITNNSDIPKRIFLEKGRILETAKINADHYQSIIITEGEGWIEIPPQSRVQRQIKGLCLHKGLKFPEEGGRINLTPFIANAELLSAGTDQNEIHAITGYPRENVQIITGKGYSDANKDGREVDREEAFKNAVEDAARKSGFLFSSETFMENMNLLKTRQRLTMEEKSIRLNNMIHEEYDAETGEYLYIGEFEVRSKPSVPEIK